MAGDVIASLLIKLGLDARDVEAGVKKTQGAFGGIGTGAKVAFGVAAGAAAVGFGLMAKGAAEMESAQGRFQAATGASREEAVAFSRDMNDLVGSAATVGTSFETIAAAGTAVAEQMQITGEQGKALTEDFLAFAKVTNQEAVGAVEAFDDILDSWGLTADEAIGIMDKLVVSHQKYGGTVADNQKTLAALAPAMKAANMEIDDGIALLNLFGAKGIDANTASAAFAKSLTKVKSPEELQAMIEDIAATDDAFERAQKAGDLFGARAGAKLGNALAGANLDDYKISIDEAAGATEKASEALVTTSDKFRMFFERVGSGLRGLGADFGPLVSGIAGLGALFAPLAGRLAPAAAAAGARVGAAFAGAEAAGGFIGKAAGLIKSGLPLILKGLGPVAVAVTIAWVIKEPLNEAIDKQFGAVGKELESFENMTAFVEEGVRRGFRNLGGSTLIDPATGQKISEQIRQDIREHLWGPTIEGVVEDGSEAAQTLADRLGSDWQKRWGDVGLATASGADAAARVATSSAEEASRRMSATGLSDAFAKIPPEVKDDFKDIAAAIRSGFGSVKKALEGGNRIIDPETRMKNMRSRLGEAARNLRKAIEVGDPFAIGYWRAAVQKQRLNLDSYQQKARDIFAHVQRDTTRKATATADAAIREARRLRNETRRILSFEAGAAIMQAFYSGQGSAVPVGSMPNLGASSRMPAGAISGGGGRGGDVHLHIGTLVADDHGLRELDRRLARARRRASRER